MSMATLSEKKRGSKKTKEPEPPVVLRTPAKPQDVHTVTPMELFRLMIDDKPYVAMVMEGGTPMLAWDKNGKPATIGIGNATLRAKMSFLDYLTEDEGLSIPGSAKERAEIAEDDGAIPVAVVPTPRTAFQQVPDGVPFVVRYHDSDVYLYHGIIEHGANGQRYALLFHRDYDIKGFTRPSHDNAIDDGASYRMFVDYLPLEDAGRFADHPYRKLYHKA